MLGRVKRDHGPTSVKHEDDVRTTCERLMFESKALRAQLQHPIFSPHLLIDLEDKSLKPRVMLTSTR